MASILNNYLGFSPTAEADYFSTNEINTNDENWQYPSNFPELTLHSSEITPEEVLKLLVI